VSLPHKRFIQIHSLASYPAVLLNRDDSGMAKRLPFGGTTRTRVSSQSLKRHWRFAGEANHDDAARVPFSLQSLGLPMGDRSKDIMKYAVMPAASASAKALHSEVLATLENEMLLRLYGDKAGDAKTRQALFFGHPEIAYLQRVAIEQLGLAATTPELTSVTTAPDKKVLKAFAEKVKENLKPLRDNLRALALGAGLESALFGRMVTSDTASNKDAPVHVAHAFTVHAMERDLDFATAVDDLRNRDESADAGSAGMFDIELTSGLFYSYVSIDVALLVANLSSDATQAGAVLGRLVQLIARVSPGAKKGSTAPFAHAEWLMVEAGDDQPRTLANAFRQAVPLQGNVFEQTMLALQAHLQQLDAAYGAQTQRVQLSVTAPAVAGVDVRNMQAVVAWLQTQLQSPPAPA
jgi:CRISPR system Cascade subunit CasC